MKAWLRPTTSNPRIGEGNELPTQAGGRVPVRRPLNHLGQRLATTAVYIPSVVRAARVVVGVDGDVPLVVMIGEFDMSTTGDLRDALNAVSGGHESIIVDLTDTTFLDSTAVSTLAMAAGRNRLRIRGAAGVPRRILEATGVIKFMEDEG